MRRSRVEKNWRRITTVLSRVDLYFYKNLNPKGKKTGDCVIRATALALGIDWYDASDMLYEQARSCGCEMSCLGCYSKLFRRLGLEKVDLSKTEMTIAQAAELYNKHTVLIRVPGHLTCAICGKIHDIWDCSEKYVDCLWVVK